MRNRFSQNQLRILEAVRSNNYWVVFVGEIRVTVPFAKVSDLEYLTSMGWLFEGPITQSGERSFSLSEAEIRLSVRWRTR